MRRAEHVARRASAVAQLCLVRRIHAMRSAYNPLHDAGNQNHKAKVVKLLSEGADPNARNRHGHTALHEAVFYRRYELVPILLAHGADPHLDSGNHGDCYDIAAGRDDIEMLELLPAVPNEHQFA
jgi:ankyrin repeat protein